MKKIILITAAFCFCLFTGLSAQNQWAFFEDKGPEQSWYASHPEQLLSERALAKRAQNGIPLGARDIPVSKSYLQSLKDAGLELGQASKWINAVSIKTDLNLAQLQAYCPAITHLHPVATFALNQSEITDIADLPKEDGLESLSAFDYGASQAQIELINANCLHDRGFTGKDVLIAVFDGGFFSMDTISAFDSLWMNNRVITWHDFVDGDTTLFQDSPHGMNVSSIILGNLPGAFMGSGFNASVALARTEDVSQEVHQEEDNWLAAVEWADSLGADIIQSSLGYSEFDPGEGDYTYADMDGNTTIVTKAADIAAGHGIIVVNSAGNSGNSPWHYITAPCDADSILCVGATDYFSNIAGFSSVGPSSDGRVKPEVVGVGQGTAIIGPSGNVTFGSGTSFSSPLVCGMVACLVEAHPQRNNMDIIQAVIQSADRYTMPDTAFGYGMPDACKADSILNVQDSLATMAEVAVNPDRFFRIYPNPVSDFLTIEPIALGAPITKIEVMSNTGMTIMKSNTRILPLDRQRLELKDLAAGMYLLKVTIGDKHSFVHKFIKQ